LCTELIPFSLIAFNLNSLICTYKLHFMADLSDLSVVRDKYKEKDKFNTIEELDKSFEN